MVYVKRRGKVILSLHDHDRYAAKQLMINPTKSLIIIFDAPDSMDAGVAVLFKDVVLRISFPRR